MLSRWHPEHEEKNETTFRLPRLLWDLRMVCHFSSWLVPSRKNWTVATRRAKSGVVLRTLLSSTVYLLNTSSHQLKQSIWKKNATCSWDWFSWHRRRSDAPHLPLSLRTLLVTGAEIYKQQRLFVDYLKVVSCFLFQISYREREKRNGNWNNRKW